MGQQRFSAGFLARPSAKYLLALARHFPTAIAAVILSLTLKLHLDRHDATDLLEAPARPAPRQVAAVRQAPDLSQIPSWHLFGLPEQPPDPRLTAQTPETRLDLSLKGVFFGTHQKDGRAIISSAEGEDEFMVGDTLTGAVSLYAIEPHRVIIKRNGRLESLSLPRATLQGQTPGLRAEADGRPDNRRSLPPRPRRNRTSNGKSDADDKHAGTALDGRPARRKAPA